MFLGQMLHLTAYTFELQDSELWVQVKRGR